MTLFPPPSLQDADTLNVQDDSAAMGNGRCAPQQAVGAGLHDRIAEDRLDALISDLEAKAKQAEADGDPHGAAIYRERRDAAAACRTPEHRSRLHSTADQYLNDLDAADAIGGCFFDAMGQAQRR
jgi:hypothetical protein